MYVTMLIELPPGMNRAAKTIIAALAKVFLAALRWLAACLGWTMMDGYWTEEDDDDRS